MGDKVDEAGLNNKSVYTGNLKLGKFKLAIYREAKNQRDLCRDGFELGSHS